MQATEIAWDPSKKHAASKIRAEEVDLVNVTNKTRKRAGLKPLVINKHLMYAARKHSVRMARKRHLSHLIKGKDFAVRLKKSGYAFVRAGENVGRSRGSSSQIVKSWMNSPVHRKNILNSHFKEIGVGIAKTPQGEKYFTQVFGAQE